MAFTKLFLSVRLLSIEANFGKTVLRSYSGTLEASACNKNEDKLKTDKTSASGPASRKGVVLGVYEEGEKLSLTPAAEEINQKSGGKLCKYLNELSCELRLGKSFVVTDVVADGGSVALASLGPRDPPHDPQEGLDEAKENVRVGVGAGVSCLRSRGVVDIAVDVAGFPRAAAEAAHLAAWTFQEFKSTVGRKSEVRLSALGGERGEWSSGVVLGESQNWARYLCDMPANVMTPAGLAQEALDVLCPLGVQVSVRERKWAEAQRMETFLSVARGSCEPPLLLECHYRPEPDAHGPPVLLAATGVTFDSGGLCLKSRTQMSESRGCMSGAAVVLAALRALAIAKVAINVTAIIPLCENMVSGQCLKVGDVVTALNGTRIQIEDTDMEGRLLLADALVYGQTLIKPALVLDVAALTQDVALATGGGAFGCFSNNDSAWTGLRGAGAETGDRPWRLPLWSYYGRDIQADPAVDLRNRGSGEASPCVGAAFLKNFICTDWMHLDITGVGKLAHARAPPYLDPSRMTGRPTRTLAAFLTNSAGRGGARPGSGGKCG
ncbi:cytosol aminopeptidase-like [Pieris brassicae]|uniref:cytosol aminopeptidase-like n=1 Tax=Pieris brassicae TaxID=7116 RepID=UPI001E660DFB|nr:cytosol aminopeptidase-like [Pieris brassicae]